MTRSSQSDTCGVAITDIRHDGNRFGFLIVHRLGGTPNDAAYVADGLARAGYSVECPLLYGHGGSRALLAATTWQQWYQSVLAAHDRLSERCDTIMAGGIGVGAMLSLLLAADRREKVDALALFAPTFWPNGWAMPWYGRALRLIGNKRLANMFSFNEREPYGIKDETLRAQSLNEIDLNGRHRDDVLGRSGGTMLEVKWLAKATTRRLGEVGQPCLIFHPRHDDRSALDASQMLQRKLSGVVDLVVLEDSYHLVTRDRQRALVLEKVLEFATALPALTAGPAPDDLE